MNTQGSVRLSYISLEHSTAFIFDWIFFVLAGNKDMHISLDEFEF